MYEVQELRRLVAATFPSLKINEFKVLGKGKSGAICLANGEIIFKIPLQNKETRNNIEMAKNEVAVLKFLEDKLDIEIPKILYAETSEEGLYIIGESLLSGTPFSYELSDTFDEETKVDVLRQLGKIVRNLHMAGGHDPTWHKNKPESLDKIINEFNTRLSDDARGLFTAEQLYKIEKFAERYRQITEKHPVKPVLCHHDLHFYNLMFDTKNKRISGLLDFGCAGYAEPAMDWYYYFDAKNVLEGYGDIGDEFFLERQKFHALSHLLSNLGEKIKEKKPHKSLDFIKKYILNEL